MPFAVDGAGLRAARALPARVRRGRVEVRPRLESLLHDGPPPARPAGGDAVRPTPTTPSPVRRGDDARTRCSSSRAARSRTTGREGPRRNRANVLIGFPLGGCCRSPSWRPPRLVLRPARHRASTRSSRSPSRSPSRSASSAWRSLLRRDLRGHLRRRPRDRRCRPATPCRQFFGWQWGKFVRPAEAARSTSWSLALDRRRGVLALTGVDPIKVTEYSIVLSAAALPLTYFPILVVANDPATWARRRTDGPEHDRHRLPRSCSWSRSRRSR